MAQGAAIDPPSARGMSVATGSNKAVHTIMRSCMQKADVFHLDTGVL